MPRLARKKSDTGVYHIMLRGINKQNLFEDNEDRQRFIDTIEHYKLVSNYIVYGYCLMNNHIHLLLRETNEPISNAIKRISSSYVYWYNQKYERCGHLFQERFRSEVVETDAYFLTVLRYIHQNPIKAGIINDIKQFRWSSYQDYLETPRVSDINFALDLLSDNRVEAKELFRIFTNEGNDDQCLDYSERKNLTDEDVKVFLNNLGFSSFMELHRLQKKQRDNVLRELISISGVSTRQLARITGISRSVIDRA
ncbi:transposase [Desulfosporosinus nitroreducens]|uniref:Transposase n=1 Tax=Desulfosporosinus nitroreducens TaxID=2018668 RepID=A0ABT8QK43_9FIRM|nr:transposase [Desulfosporosinus nitroreducens]MDO0821693.1 transposase [Desulfosporosinus nitroreducens]